MTPENSAVEEETYPSIAQAAQYLLSRLSAQVLPTGNRIASIRVKTHNYNLLDWLSLQLNDTKTYWRSRRGTFTTAGLGAAHVFRGDLGLLDADLARISQILAASDRNIKFYGGMRFGPSRDSDTDWQEFAGFRFVVPAVELTYESGHTWLSCAVHRAEQIENVKNILASVISIEQVKPDQKQAKLIEISDEPTQVEWKQSISAILNSIAHRKVDKVVLARKRTLSFSEQIQPFALLQRASHQAQESYGFAFQNKTGDTYIGISPEQIFFRDGRNLYSESLAGTRPRGSSDAQDQVYCADLLLSEKEKAEHQCVSDFIVNQGSTLCDDFRIIDCRSVLKLAKVQHLRSSFRGTLKPGILDADILKTFHPTPALCGYPVPYARHMIEQCEKFDRGCFTGAVGYVGRDQTEFAAGIRIALTKKNKLHLFAGAGIVAGSRAEDEWMEIHNKMRAYLDLFSE